MWRYKHKHGYLIILSTSNSSLVMSFVSIVGALLIKRVESETLGVPFRFRELAGSNEPALLDRGTFLLS